MKSYKILKRIQKFTYLKFVQCDSFDVCYGGGEENVRVSLANYGLDACFVTKLPKNELGESAINALMHGDGSGRVQR